MQPVVDPAVGLGQYWSGAMIPPITKQIQQHYLQRLHLS